MLEFRTVKSIPNTKIFKNSQSSRLCRSAVSSKIVNSRIIISYLLLENNNYLLYETDDKILLY